MTRTTRYNLGLLFLAFFVTAPWLGLTRFYTRGEPREALVIQNMVQSGHWLLADGYGGAVPSKPPLMHWLAGLASLPAGEVSEFTARLPSCLAGILFLLYFFNFFRPRIGNGESLLSALLLLTSFEWFRAMSSCRVDMIFSVMSAVALLELFRWWERDLKGCPWLAALSLSGAILTKGPAGIVLPLGVAALFCLFKRERLLPVCARLLMVAALPLLAAAIWYLLAYKARPDAFMEKVYYENVARFLGTQDDEPHRHGLFYLPVSLFLGYLPWTLLLVPALIGVASCAVRRWRRWKIWLGTLSDIDRYLLLAFLAYLFFFSLPSGKRGVYLLPVYPFAALWLARLWNVTVEISDVYKSRAVAATAYAGIAVSVLVLAAGLGRSPGRYPGADAEYFASAMFILVRSGSFWQILTVLIPLLAGLVLLSRKWLWIEAAVPVFAMMYIMYLVSQSVLLPGLMNGLSGRGFAEKIAKGTEASEPLYSFRNEFYSVSFYMKRRIDRLEQKSPKSGLVLLRDRDLPQLVKAKEGCDTAVLLRSSAGIIKPADRTSLVRYVCPQT